VIRSPLGLSERVECGHLISITIHYSLFVYQPTIFPFIIIIHGLMIGILVLTELIKFFTVFLVIKGEVVPFVILGLVRICFQS
jgi:hypothetical protein